MLILFNIGFNSSKEFPTARYWLGKYKQARKAHSSAFCIDLHRQTLMTMIGNDDNDGQ